MPTYSPCSIAEHSVALALALNRYIAIPHQPLAVHESPLVAYRPAMLSTVRQRLAEWRRNLIAANARVQQGNFTLSGLRGFEVRGKTIGIIGTGAHGTARVVLQHILLYAVSTISSRCTKISMHEKGTGMSMSGLNRPSSSPNVSITTSRLLMPHLSQGR